MKFIVALLLFVSVPAALASFAPEVENVLYKMEKECSAYSGFIAERVEVVRIDYKIPDDDAAKKWAKCMLQKHDAIKADGTVNFDLKTVHILDDTSSVSDAFEICSKLVGRTIDDTAMLMWNCYTQNSQGLLMAPFRRRRTDERKRFLSTEDNYPKIVMV